MENPKENFVVVSTIGTTIKVEGLFVRGNRVTWRTKVSDFCNSFSQDKSSEYGFIKRFLEGKDLLEDDH